MPAPHVVEDIVGPIQPMPLERIAEQTVAIPVPEELAGGDYFCLSGAFKNESWIRLRISLCL